MSEDATSFVEKFRTTPRPFDDSDRRLLSDEDFQEAVCRAIYESDDPSDRYLAVELFREEMRLRKVDQCHSGDRLILSALVLALSKDASDVLLFWEAKQIDFDMGCCFDVQLMVFGGLDKTLNFLRQQSGADAYDAAEHLKACQEAGDLDDIEGYVSDKLAYFGLPER